MPDNYRIIFILLSNWILLGVSMVQWIEYIGLGGATVLLGWFAPRVFVNAQWPTKTKVIFTTTLTVFLFFVLGAYKLTTGEDLTDAVAAFTLCKIHSFANCPKSHSSDQTPETSSPSSSVAGEPRIEAKPTPAKPAPTDAAKPPELGVAKSTVAPSGSVMDDLHEQPPPTISLPDIKNTERPPQSEGDARVPQTREIETPKPESSPRYGISLVLDGLTEIRNRYVATIRIKNSNDTDVGIALLSTGASRAEFFLTDSMGGSCQMAANGEGWGTLKAYSTAAIYHSPQVFTLVPANAEVRHTIFFNKGRCDSRLADTSGISLNGTFVLTSGSYIPISFSDLTMTVRND